MVAKLLIIFVIYFKRTNSQYYGQSAHNSYQPYNYYFPTPTTSVPQPMYPAPTFLQPTYPPTSFTQPPAFVSPTPTYSSTNPILPTFAPSSLSPVLPTFQPSTFSPPIPAQPTFSLSTPAYPPTFPQTPTYPSSTYSSATTFAATQIPFAPVSLPIYQTTPTSAATPKFAPVGSATPKCSPPTATAYYLTTALQAPKTAVMKEKVKENLLETLLPPPTYHCPYCTGFANVPKSSKISPPPTSSSVLPGILDKIPTIALPDELKLKDLGKTPPLLSDLFEHKLSGKLRFDEDLLDGFLTGLGLGKR